MKWVREEEEEQGNEAKASRKGSSERSELCSDEGQAN